MQQVFTSIPNYIFSTSQTYGLYNYFLNNCFLGEYGKVRGIFCEDVGEEEFKTLLVAKMACDSNPDCFGIYNGQCNGKRFMLCMKVLFEGPNLHKSDESSCVYMKKPTKRNIFHRNHISIYLI